MAADEPLHHSQADAKTSAFFGSGTLKMGKELVRVRHVESVSVVADKISRLSICFRFTELDKPSALVTIYLQALPGRLSKATRSRFASMSALTPMAIGIMTRHSSTLGQSEEVEQSVNKSDHALRAVMPTGDNPCVPRRICRHTTPGLTT
jgi:cobalamin biosynthesis protein CbiD